MGVGSRELVVQADDCGGSEAKQVVGPQDFLAVEVDTECLVDGRTCGVDATILDDDVGSIVTEAPGW